VVINEDVQGSLAPPNNGVYPKLYPVGDLSNQEGVVNFNKANGMLWAVSQAAYMCRVDVKYGI
jgi:hypothetical protein